MLTEVSLNKPLVVHTRFAEEASVKIVRDVTTINCRNLGTGCRQGVGISYRRYRLFLESFRLAGVISRHGRNKLPLSVASQASTGWQQNQKWKL